MRGALVIEVAILGLVIGLAMIRDRARLRQAVLVVMATGGAVIWWNGGPLAAGPSGQTAILVMIVLGAFAVGAGFRWWQMRAGPLAPLSGGQLALMIGFGAVGYLAAIVSR